MQINPCYNIPSSGITPPSFSAAKDITLKYAVSKYPYMLPQRVYMAAKKIIETHPKGKHPTLYDLHIETYKGLLSCKNLDEARNMFPEFREVLDASIFKHSRSKHLKNLTVPLEDLSLTILQRYYGKLKPQHEIARELGFVNKNGFDWLKDKIRFVTFKKNYLTLLYSSDETKNKIIAQKTRNFNQRYPERMYAHNKQAAQSNKSEIYRKNQSQRIKQYDLQNPERKEKIGKFTREVWNRLPHIKLAISKEMAGFPGMGKLIPKYINHEQYNDTEKRINKKFFKYFWKKYPEYKKEFAQMCKKVSQERKNKKIEI